MNTASGQDSSVSSGISNQAFVIYPPFSGESNLTGYACSSRDHLRRHRDHDQRLVENKASGSYSSVSGGASNTASGYDSNVSGGYQDGCLPVEQSIFLGEHTSHGRPA